LVLSPKEILVLMWAARGKSAWETSRIINRSESTVIKHLASAQTKLGCANKTHTIAVALLRLMREAATCGMRCHDDPATPPCGKCPMKFLDQSCSRTER
jgi:DNA-binding CsgD family transcriptional regulator